MTATRPGLKRDRLSVKARMTSGRANGGSDCESFMRAIVTTARHRDNCGTRPFHDGRGTDG